MKNNSAYILRNNQYFKQRTLSLKRVVCFALIIMITLFNGSLFAVELENVLISQLPSNKIQINLKTSSGEIPEPKVFKTQKPARVVFDFPGLKSSLEKTDFIVNKGAVTSLKVVEVSDRTRFVLSLTRTVPFNVTEIDGQFAIVVDPVSIARNNEAETKPFAKQPEIVSARKINSIDFRRTPNSGGKVVIKLSDPDTVVNLGQKDGEVLVDFRGASIDSSLEKRLDVTDFATPVSVIDTFQNGENVRMIISPSQEFQQISFQNNDIFTIILDPIIEEEKEEESDLVDENGFTGERLSLNFQRLEIRSALSVISDFTGLNIIVSDDVEGELTLNLKDVPWDQALEVILDAKGLAKRQKGNVIWVAPARRITEFEQQQLEAAQATAALEPLISEVININFANAEDLRDVILGETRDRDRDRQNGNGTTEDRPVIFLQPEGNGSVQEVGGSDGSATLNITADERTNSLIVTTSRANLVAVKALIAELDRPVRQVMVETRIVNASDTFSRELGARLGFTRLNENARGLGSGSNLGNTSFSGSIDSANAAQQSLIDGTDVFGSSTPGGLNVDLGANGVNGFNPAATAFSLFRAGSGFANIINLELSALEGSGQGKVISSPRLVTANQQSAEIRTGETRFVDIQNNDGNTVSEARDAFLSLNVTPQISPDDNIILDVEISQDFFLVDDSIQRNNIETQVTVENGETVIIGGIYQENKSTQVTKVPFLGDIPYLGNLFKQRSRTDTRTELLIFLTPRIIDGKVTLN